MPRSWVEGSKDPRFRLTSEYRREVDKFIEYAFSGASCKGEQIVCPCTNCLNQRWRSAAEVLEHLVCDGFQCNYTEWTYHGEGSSSFTLNHDNIVERDAGETIDVTRTMLNEMQECNANIPNYREEGVTMETDKFRRLLEDSKKELYSGCVNHTKLSFILRLYHIKCLGNWTDKSFSMLLDLLRESFPVPNEVPSTLYETKKLIKDLGLNYNKIDVCPNDCMLYWKEAKNKDFCSNCGKCRWSSVDRKIPAKTLRHFPLIPRLQRLYMSSKTSLSMMWHHENRTEDERLRHPADGQAWKEFDKLYPSFSIEPRNIRLGLATDGFNPFNCRSSKHSIWPVVVIPYNLPPWMCMKPDYLLLTLLIPGPRQPGNDIDIYLEPLIEELKELWNTGVMTYDGHKKAMFNLKASLLWTINDFPAYAVLSGWSTKGALACPCCNKDTDSRWLKYGRKHCYLGHRRFLPINHRYRRDKRNFDGHEDHRPQPKPISGFDILEQLQGVQFLKFGKENDGTIGMKTKRRKKHPVEAGNWKKKSIFFELPYWRFNLLRHNLDVMHIEKNVCDSIIGTLLGIKAKSKDNVNSRLDLREMDVRSDLQPKFLEGKKKLYIPPACYTLTNTEKEMFCSVLRGVKVPDGLSSDISKLVEKREITGLKSHDCHILMQQLLPVVLRTVLPKNVSVALIELCAFYRDLCSKVATEVDYKRLAESVALTLCKLEMIFPPSFFDVMVHLNIHLAHEAILGGPVQYRWMYPIERFLKRLKDYVRNYSRPEGSIAERYVADEALTFCSRYFEGVETRSNRPIRNGGSTEMEDPESIFPMVGRPVGKCEMVRLSWNEREQAHRYVLNNYDGVNEFREEHKQQIKRKLGRNGRQRVVDDKHSKEFPTWFNDYILKLRMDNVEVPDHIKWLARGPNSDAKSYTEYIINGIRFRTKAHENNRKTQNSGVYVTAVTTCYSSSKDKRPVEGDVPYYGVLKKVIELEYTDSIKVMLFQCDWVDIHRGVERDEYGFTIVNFNRLLYIDGHQESEPFVFPSQAEQVFYISDPHRPEWQVAIRTKSRDIFDMGGDDEGDKSQAYTQSTLEFRQNLETTEADTEADISWFRSDVDGVTIDTPNELTNQLESLVDSSSN